jgi:hypothetical protein
MPPTIQTYDSNALTLATTDPQLTTLKLSVSTSLMTNYEPSRSVDSQQAIDVVEDVNGNPIVFSIGTANQLYAILRTADPTAAWTQVDLTSGLGAGWQVHTFRVLQTPQQAIHLAIGVTDSSGNGHFYLTAALSNDPANAVWISDFTAQWVERISATPFTAVTHILMSGGATAADAPTVVATVTLAGGASERFYVNGDTTSDLNQWVAWPIPQNASDIVDVAVGTLPGLGAGSFVLYHVGSALQLDFTRAATMNGQYISRSLTPPDGAMALGTIQNASDGSTDLYVAGNGVFRFAAAEMKASGATAENIGGTIAAGSGTEIVVRQDDDNIAVWVLDEGLLYYLHGTRGATIEWTAPLPIQQDVGQIAALRNTVRDTNELFLVTAGQQLAYLYQDPVSTDWNEMVIPLADVGSALPFQCYTTHIALTDQSNNPVTRPFAIGATEWTYLTVNGASHIVDQNTTSAVTPDATGSLTIIIKVATLSAPTLHLSAGFLPVVIDVNPQSVVNGNLRQFTTESALASATTQTGAALIAGATEIPVASAAGALQQLTALHDSTAASSSSVSTRPATAAPANVIDATALPSDFGFAVTDVGTSSAAFHSAPAALAAVPHLHAHAQKASALHAPHIALVTTDAGDEIKAFFGDVMRTVANDLETVGAFLMNVSNDVVTFTLKLADKTVSFAVDTVQKVMSVIDYVLKKIALTLEQVIEWIGFLFNWDDILTAHAIIVNAATKVFEYTELQIANADALVTNFFNTLKTEFGNLAPLQGADASATVLARSTNPAPTFSPAQTQGAGYLNSPGGTFAKYHVQHSGLLSATPPTTSTPATAAAAAPTGNPIADVFTQVIEPVGKDIANTCEDLFLDLRDGFVNGTLTPNQVLAKLKTDAISDVLTTAQSAAAGTLTVAGDVVSSIQGLIDKKWNIPFLSALYKSITNGSELSLLDAVALLIAIPAVPMYKLVSGSSPFAGGTYGLDDTNTPADVFFAGLRGESTFGRNSVGAAGASAAPAAILYSQIGGCFYLAAETVSMSIDAVMTESDEEAPPACHYIALACETIMQAGSFPIGDGAAVTLLRILWGFYVLTLLRFVALILAGAAAEAAVGVFEIFLAVVKALMFLIAIVLQTAHDTGAELALEWETFVGNLFDALGRGLSGAAKIDPDKEISGLGLDVLAVFATVIAIYFDAVRLSIVFTDDELKEYHCF